MRKWEELPKYMQNKEVKEYYDILIQKKNSLFLKRIFDIVLGTVCLMVLLIPMFIVSVIIIGTSPGGVLYCQERVTRYGKRFKIHKFRTMIANADQLGAAVTVEGDCRVTKVGKILRKYRIDEFPQVIDILLGNMSFVGTRPEISKYVEQYSDEMYATLLLPAGITSEASIRYKDESELLKESENADRIYVEQILPEKMKYNLKSIRGFSFWGETKTMFRTVFSILGKKYE